MSRFGWKAGVAALLTVAVLGTSAVAFAAPRTRRDAARDRREALLGAVVHADMIAMDGAGQAHDLVYDRGEITSIDYPGKSLDLLRKDGVSVHVIASDTTKVYLNGKHVRFDALKVSDKLGAFAEKENGQGGGQGNLSWFLLRVITERPRPSASP